MKAFIKFLVIVLFFINASFLHARSTMNCQNGGSASVGDLKHQVRLDCGEPERSEIIGYIDKVKNNQRIKVMKIEEWIYSGSFYGQDYFYSLVFEGNKLVEINKIAK